MDSIPQIVQTVLTFGGGAWIVSWLKEVIKETFKKIDLLEKEVNELKLEKRLRKEIEDELKAKQ
jgi:hypothetical protein